MKNDIQNLIEKLQSEKRREMLIREDLLKTLDEAKAQREIDRQSLIETLVPDTSSDTLKEIQEKFEHFYIPCVEKWSWLSFGFKSVLNPGVSLESLRKRLYDYISKMKLWPLDADGTNKINAIISQSLETNQKVLDSLGMKLEALRKLYDIDETKLSPEMRKRMRTAVSNISKSDKTTILPDRSDMYIYRDYPDNDSGSGLLELWFWYVLLSDDSDFASEINSDFGVDSEPHYVEGVFDGAGAEQDISFEQGPLVEDALGNENLDVPSLEQAVIASEIVSEEAQTEVSKPDETFSGAAFSLDSGGSDSSTTSSRSADCVVETSNCDCNCDCTSNCDCSSSNDGKI